MAYAGDLKPIDAWQLLKVEPTAQLVDVRTQSEWTFVGIPNLEVIGKKAAFVPWQLYPNMQANPAFADELRHLAPATDAALLFLCRSGARSRAAAEAMTALGYRRCYNVADGFEGPVDDHGHRGHLAGWKASGLPWTQA